MDNLRFTLCPAFFQGLVSEGFGLVNISERDQHLPDGESAAGNQFWNAKFAVGMSATFHRCQRISVVVGGEMRPTDAFQRNRELQRITGAAPQLEALIG